ncbi:MAG: insulinase family protein [Spirochaetaceae bacterium]|nr:insulinase family protein [Spirochaetaceae bacterium]
MIKKYSKFFLTVLVFVACCFVTACTTSGNSITGNSLTEKSTIYIEESLLKQDPEIISGVLDNGLSYYIRPNKTPYNRISLRLVVKVGSLAEKDSEKGVAHFVEHMCFNGTEHFEKNSLIDYAESIGMDFGAEVNAYTSFEETVYMFEIPADKGEYLEQGILIFHDWASAVTFDQEELDKERGVITEEWRGRLGLNGRLTDTILPFELKDSPYVDRLPIGDMNVIQNITRDEVVAFYKRWYRPENMAVVISGMVDPQVAEFFIKKTMGEIPASNDIIEPPKGSVPVRTEKDVIVFKDAEMPYTQVQLVSQDEVVKPITTEEDLRESFLTDIVISVLSARLSEITQTVDAPWLMASAVHYTETNSATFHGLTFVPKEGMFAASFQQILDENARLLAHGITQSEFDRVKDSILVSENQRYDQRETIASQSRAQEIVNYVLLGDTVVSDDDYIEIACRLLSSITEEEADEVARKLFQDRGTLCIIYAPESVELPSNDDIISFWENYVSEIELTAYEDFVVEDELMEKPAEKANIVSTANYETLGFTDYVLSNGARIIVKKTNFDKSKIYMSAASEGGASLVSDDDYASCVVAPMYALYSGISGMNIAQLQKYLSNKYIGFNLSINEHSEIISTETNSQNLEEMLQLVNRFFLEPQFTDEGWNYICMIMDQQAKMYNIQPEDVMLSRARKILYGDSIRHTAINPEFVSKMDKTVSEKCFRERFSNAADFTFTFVGDIDEEVLVELCQYYIGSIPSDSSKRESGFYEPFTFPAGITKETVKKGQENKGKVLIAFGGSLPAAKDVQETRKDIDMMEELRSLVEIKLREIIREDMSGTYGVSVTTEIDGYPERYYKFQISFGCEPSREKELTNEVISALNKLRTELVDESYIAKLHESFRRNFEVNSKNAQWWINMINAVEVFKYLPAEVIYDDNSVRTWTTAEYMRDLAKKYLKTDNYVCVFLEPEIF